MKTSIRRIMTITNDKFIEAGQLADRPQRKVAVVAVLQNPYVGRYVADLSPMVEASRDIGARLAGIAMEALGSYKVESYGKGGLVGIDGEQEHANAMLTIVFAEPFRAVIGKEARAWISSMTKVAGPGTLIDIPMNSVEDVYVRSHYDGISLTLPDAPLPDEIALIFCLASRGRLNARVGGMTRDEARQRRER